MFISTAIADGVKSIVKNDSSLSSYFLSQFENLTPGRSCSDWRWAALWD